MDKPFLPLSLLYKGKMMPLYGENLRGSRRAKRKIRPEGTDEQSRGRSSKCVLIVRNLEGWMECWTVLCSELSLSVKLFVLPLSAICEIKGS